MENGLPLVDQIVRDPYGEADWPGRSCEAQQAGLQRGGFRQVHIKAPGISQFLINGLPLVDQIVCDPYGEA